MPSNSKDAASNDTLTFANFSLSAETSLEKEATQILFQLQNSGKIFKAIGLKSPSEFFITALLPESQRTEAIFTRILEIEKQMVVLTHTHFFQNNDFQEISEWLQSHGDERELAVMNFTHFPAPTDLAHLAKTA